MADYDAMIGVLLVTILVASLVQFHLEAQHAGLWHKLGKSTQKRSGHVIHLWSWLRNQRDQNHGRFPGVELAPNRRDSRQAVEDVSRTLRTWPLLGVHLTFISWYSIAMSFAWAAVSILSGVQMGRSISAKYSLKIDPDIAGTRILIGLFTPAILTALNLVFGHFHSQDGGILEIGTAHFANLSSLLINTLKALWCGSIDQLTEEERLIAAISINLCCTGLRMSFSDKTALASRSFMALSSVSRLFGIICMFILLESIGHTSAASSISTLHWYGVIQSGDGLCWSVWALLANNCMIWMSDTLLVAYGHTPDFDKAQKTHKRNTFHAFPTLRATVLLKHVQSLPVLIMDMWAILALTQGSDRGSLADWGQSAALATILTTIAHWGYRVLYDILWKPWHNSRWLNFSWLSPGEFDAPLNDTGHWPHEAATRTKQELQGELIEACRTNDITWFDEIMQQLENEDVNFVDQETNTTPLLVAIENGSLLLVKKLKENHQASSAYLDTETAVVRAAELGRHNILTYLILDSPFPEDPCQLSRKGISPLQLACQNGHWDVFEVLLRQSSVMTGLVSDSNVLFSFLEGLIDNGKLAGIQRFKNMTASRQLPIELKDSSGWTLLHHAASKGDTAILEELLSQITEAKDGFVLNAVTSDGMTVLHIAARAGHVDVASALLEYSDEINTDIIDKHGRSVLSYAAGHGSLDLVRRLSSSLEGDSREMTGGKAGRTPLSYAAGGLHLEVMEHLLDTGADPYVFDESCTLPMAYAFEAICREYPSSPPLERPPLPDERNWRLNARAVVRKATNGIADMKWDHFERLANRSMGTKSLGDVEKWRLVLKSFASRTPGMSDPMRGFVSWLCHATILDPTTTVFAADGPFGEVDSYLPHCLLYFVAENRLQHVSFLFNSFRWSTAGANISQWPQKGGIPDNRGSCPPIYVAKAIEMGILRHAQFLIEDLGINIDDYGGLFVNAAVASQRVKSVTWVLSKGPNLALGMRTPLAVNAASPPSEAKRAITKLLLHNKAPVNPARSGSPIETDIPLFNAVQWHDATNVLTLLKHGARMDLDGSRWNAPSILAVALYGLQDHNTTACQETMTVLMEHGARFNRADRKCMPLDDYHQLLHGAGKPFLEALIKSDAYIKSNDPNSSVMRRLKELCLDLLPTTQDINWDPEIKLSWQSLQENPTDIQKLEASVGTLWKLMHPREGVVSETEAEALRERLASLNPNGERLIIEEAVARQPNLGVRFSSGSILSFPRRWPGMEEVEAKPGGKVRIEKPAWASGV